ncbi:hypothetical protein BD310DRAFT_913136 [Dichomitus squalens]|uniref:Uncharacterized protein n=1 Tax=Dichomitus squalens TaxID=114155 RepID=A0A4V6MWZ2_9APHY|nr:hypothetical protein BD310DRAFT_913136 [Dichomitus squalens]
MMMSAHPYHHLLRICSYFAGQTTSRINSPHTPSGRSTKADIFLRLVLTALYASQRRSTIWTAITLNIPAHRLRQACHLVTTRSAR